MMTLRFGIPSILIEFQQIIVHYFVLNLCLNLDFRMARYMHKRKTFQGGVIAECIIQANEAALWKKKVLGELWVYFCDFNMKTGNYL